MRGRRTESFGVWWRQVELHQSLVDSDRKRIYYPGGVSTPGQSAPVTVICEGTCVVSPLVTGRSVATKGIQKQWVDNFNPTVSLVWGARLPGFLKKQVVVFSQQGSTFPRHGVSIFHHKNPAAATVEIGFPAACLY